MTTFIFKKHILTADIQQEYKHLTAGIFYEGLPVDLSISFTDTIAKERFTGESAIAIQGRFKEEIKPFKISLCDGKQVGLPSGDNWETFIIHYFLEHQVDAMALFEYEDSCSISTYLEEHYIWCKISKDKMTLHKMEFGRYLPLEKMEYKRKSTSWTKGVFVQNNDPHITFLQTSWDGEEGEHFQVSLNSTNKSNISDFLSIPFYAGWTEFDYRLNEETFYKAGAQVTCQGEEFITMFPLLDVGEQDIPFFAVDQFGQWLRTKWADSFINRFRRHLDKTAVGPIMNTNQ